MVLLEYQHINIKLFALLFLSEIKIYVLMSVRMGLFSARALEEYDTGISFYFSFPATAFIHPSSLNKIKKSLYALCLGI